MSVPGGTFLVPMGGADRAVHVQHDMLQAIAIMKPVDPLPVQVGQRGGSDCLNRFLAFYKWFSALVTPLPLGALAG
jgi:hypothetical protein